MSTNPVFTQVAFEIHQLDQLFAVYADLLLHATQHPPDLVELTALASVLHSFYNGLENIFLSIARHYDQQVPTGDRWHREVLVQMAHPTPTRAPVLSAELVGTLADYQGFRHFYTHVLALVETWVAHLDAAGTPLTPASVMQVRAGVIWATAVGSAAATHPRVIGTDDRAVMPNG